MSTSQSWLRDFADRLGVEVPSEEEVATILDLAGSAAHASQRVAAPVACWIAAAAGLSPGEALDIARHLDVES
ncbi:MAG: hypothetical protein KGL23_08235 [Acidobacteriota bacterium]|nr:hypothetical protein [Acidobacteriota bacterium]MDE3031473.1 hypothetical protein [Acidobacteriota bacterium]MDE3093938.1 hypothetical protein [Acidobacteriota bacterium]MDE3139406.1 hypothetical protein [Acidobacteriota bacterium]MDE3147405.1 hypothetical protein [Acidobacteriota bacterium]